jgi:hypothetical protein
MQPDPTGRLDLLAMKLLDRFVENSTNPVVKSMYGPYRGLVENQVTKFLGPDLLKESGKAKQKRTRKVKRSQ